MDGSMMPAATFFALDDDWLNDATFTVAFWALDNMPLTQKNDCSFCSGFARAILLIIF